MKGRLAVGLAIGAIGVMAHQHRYEQRRLKQKRYHARRKTTKKVYAAKKPSASVKKIAKAEPKPEPQVAEIVEPAENENSSISTAALAPIEETASIESTEAAASDPVEVVAESPETKPAEAQKSAGKLDCKKFFPSVGMTLSVSCE
jgi:hypothetical protein